MLKEVKVGEPLDAVIRRFSVAHGTDLSPYDEAFLLKAIDKRQAATRLETRAAYVDLLADSRAEAEALIGSLRVTYSDFFRSPVTFALLEQVVFPGLIAERTASGRGEIRIWSAGCAAGQEAWSVALLLDERAGAGSPPFSYRIFATDLPGPDLARARAGVFSAEAVGNVRVRHLRACFSKQGESFVIVPRLRERVDFSTYDLLDACSASPAASIYGDFDLVLCCNVLFYYRAHVRQQILDKVCAALSPGGYFVTGEAERDFAAKRKELRAVSPTATIFQKRVYP
jgi:chemotaxis methyl-accepting protein methylase